MQYAALVACALLIVPASAFAQTGSDQQNQATSDQQSYLNIMLARVTCEANFETSVVSAAISEIPNINQTAINSDSAKINTDLQTLANDINSGNREQVNTDLKTFRTDLKTTSLDLRTAIKNANPSSDQKAKLKSDMRNLSSTLKSCLFSANQQLANAKISAYNTGIQRVQNKTTTLQSKGVDTTQLNQLVSQAQTNLGNLAATVSSATNSSQLKAALHSYCQYNGCKSGANFHLAAQSALGAEQAVLDKIKSDPNSARYSSQIDKAQTDLTNTQNILNTVGTSKYQGTQQMDIWNSLHDAHDIIKQLWSELYGHIQKNTNSSSSSS